MDPSTFEGQAFHPDLTNGRGSGTIHIEPGRLRFVPNHAPTSPIELPFDRLGLRLGGASDRVLFFTHPDHAEVSVFTSDHGILKHPAMSSQASVLSQVSAVKRRKATLRLGFVALLAMVVLLVVGVISAWSPIVGWVTDRVPAELEVQLGELVFSQVRTQTRLVDDAEVDALLDELAAPLLAALPDTGYPFDFHLADDPSLNAFALPGGHVVLHSGLLLTAETPEEVLGVLGHELAHVTERHSLRQLVGSAGLFVAVQAVLGDMSGLAAVLADGGTQLLSLSFSRDHELDADAVGWRSLVAADIDPRGMIRFFETLQTEQTETLGEDAATLASSLDFLSTHPATDERIERLQQHEEDMDRQDFPEIPIDFLALQNKIRQVTSDSNDPAPAPDGASE